MATLSIINAPQREICEETGELKKSRKITGLKKTKEPVVRLVTFKSGIQFVGKVDSEIYSNKEQALREAQRLYNNSLITAETFLKVQNYFDKKFQHQELVENFKSRNCSN